MALDTKLIGQALGTGKGRVIDTSNVTRAVMRGEAAIARNRALQLKREQEFQKALKDRQDFNVKLLGQFKLPSFKGAPPQAMNWLNEQANNLKMQAYSIVNNPSLSKMQQQIAMNELKGKVDELTFWKEEYKESMVDFIDKTDMLSKVNSNKDLELDKARIEGNYIIEENKAIFTIDNEKIEKPISELSKGFGLIEQDHIAYNDLLKEVTNVAKKTAAQGKDKTALDFEVKEGINNLNLTDMQYLSIAVDKLGYTGTDIDILKKESTDENPDKIDVDRDKIIKFVHDNITTSANEAFSAYFESKDPKDDGTENVENLKSLAEDYTKELNDAMSNYDFSMLHNTKIGGKLITGSDIRNGKLYLEYTARTTSEGQQIAELSGIDLNNKVRLKALLSEYIKGQKGVSMSNKITNNITDESLFTIDDINKQNSILFPPPTTKSNLP